MSSNMWNEVSEKRNEFLGNHELRMNELNKAIARLDVISEVATASFEDFQKKMSDTDNEFDESHRRNMTILNDIEKILDSI